MKITHYHGMSEKAFSNWKQGGCKRLNSESSPWLCSDADPYTYLWSVEKLGSGYEENAQEQAKIRSFESAQIQASIDGSCYVYLFALNLNPELYSDDDSCPNMQECDKTECENLTADNIVSIIRVKFNQYSAPFVLRSLVSFDLFDQAKIDDSIMQIIRVISNHDIYLDEVLEYPEYTEELITI